MSRIGIMRMVDEHAWQKWKMSWDLRRNLRRSCGVIQRLELAPAREPARSILDSSAARKLVNRARGFMGKLELRAACSTSSLENRGRGVDKCGGLKLHAQLLTCQTVWGC